MNNTRNRNKSQSPGLLRGLIALSLCAVALCSVVFFLAAPRSTPDARTETTESPTIPPITLPENPYGPEDFEYQGDYLACTVGSAVLGVDVSSHQKTIDWDQVREAGMEFAIIRIGYRGTTSGGVYVDEYALENLAGARAAGLKVGVYFFSQATSPEEAVEEAELCLNTLPDQPLDLPVVFDWEIAGEDTRTANVDGDTLMDCTRAFCQRIEEAGYDAMIYFNPHVAENLLDLTALQEYPFWLAMYTDLMTWPHAVEMWQYTATGSVPGIEGDTDINLWFIS